MTSFLYFPFISPCNSHLSSICNFFVTILGRIFSFYFPVIFYELFLFYFSRMPKYLEKSDKLFSVPLMRRGIIFYFIFLLWVSLFVPHCILWHAIAYYVFIPVLLHSMPCHVNILFPCPVCVSGYRIIWHAMIYKKLM